MTQYVKKTGYTIVGPVFREGSLVYAEISGLRDLLQGWGDEQLPGHYRLIRREDQACFGNAVGPQSWKKSRKKFLYPPRVLQWQAQESGQKLQITVPDTETPRYALIGARACELAAIAVLDRVLLQGSTYAQDYQKRREQVLILAVQCTQPAATCFCTSLNTGPQVRAGADLMLTEVLETPTPWYLLETQSRRGEELLIELQLPAATKYGTRAGQRSRLKG